MRIPIPPRGTKKNAAIHYSGKDHVNADVATKLRQDRRAIARSEGAISLDG